MPPYRLTVQANAGVIDRVIWAEDDADARIVAMDELLLYCDIAAVCTSQARLTRDDKSDVWPPDTVGNLVG